MGGCKPRKWGFPDLVTCRSAQLQVCLEVDLLLASQRGFLTCVEESSIHSNLLWLPLIWISKGLGHENRLQLWPEHL